MISIEAAMNIAWENTPVGPGSPVRLKDAYGRVLAEDVQAIYPSPVFDNSAMDGYALDHRIVGDVPISETIYAGDKRRISIQAGTCSKIMTGAPIPSGADAVVPKECVEVLDGDRIRISTPVKKYAHIRFAGEEIRAGDVAMEKGSRLTPASLGYLKSLGCTDVVVHSCPRICIIPTGSELVRADRDLEFGEIYETNALTLEAAIKSIFLGPDRGWAQAAIGIHPRVMDPIPDDLDVTRRVLKEAMDKFDIVLVCGGVSVGDKDLVKGVLDECGVEKIFWGVNQKPGKPLYFGKSKGKSLVFGLPGNPAASLTCFYVYVRMCIEKWMGFGGSKKQKSRDAENFEWSPAAAWAQHGSVPGKIGGEKENRPQFKRAFRHPSGEIEVLDHQSSHMMRSFAQANCLVLGDKVIEL